MKNWQEFLAFAIILYFQSTICKKRRGRLLDKSQLTETTQLFRYKLAYVYICVLHTYMHRYTYIYIGRIYAVNYAPATICHYSYPACFETKLKPVNVRAYHLDNGIHISNIKMLNE